MNTKDLFVYTAAYRSEDDARFDLEAFRDLATTAVVGDYDTALVTKNAKGKVHVEKHGTQTTHGAWHGALAGGVIGLLFPPAILSSALIGGSIGAITGKLWGGMPRGDLKDLGEVLDTGEWGLVIIGESKLDECVEKTLKKALKQSRKALKADRKELEKELKALGVS